MEQDDPTNLPLGVSPAANNVEFRLCRARTRPGIQNRYGFLLPDTSAEAAVTGLASPKVGGNPDLQVPLAFSAVGQLWREAPVGSGHMQPITGPLVTLPAASSMQAASAFKKAFLAFGDLKNSLGSPAVYNLALDTLDPLSMKLEGQVWSRLTNYYVGEMVTPSIPIGGNGHTYRCLTAGTSAGAPPVWPLAEGVGVNDGTVLWKDTTPQMVQAIPVPHVPVVTRVPGAGTFAANRDVYIVVTLVNGSGETTTSPAFVFVNTTLNDRFTVTSPTLFLWIQALLAPYAVTGYNVYEADVATGGGAPLISAYTKVNGGAVAIGVPTNVNTTGAGAAPPLLNSALVVPVGNICSGLRYMVVLFVNRNGYISGMTSASVISYNSPTSGYQLYVPYIPIGPSNTVARICCFTPAGQLNQIAGSGISNAGPYFWIAPSTTWYAPSGIFDLTKVPGGVTVAEVVNGVNETSTLINDNTTTTATFNFDDNYLKSTLNDVSSYFRKMQVPACSDIFYSKTLRRMFYADDSLQSGWRVSLQDDPETIYSDASTIVQAAENNGENRTAVREYDSVVYLMKQKGGHVLSPNPSDPSQWVVSEQWTGSGPCGPRAVDVCTFFMCYVHRSGVWIFKGGKPFHISKEIPISWAGINWAFEHTIWVMIDDETREIRIGVPFGASTVPSKILKLNYEDSPDFAAPIRYSAYAGNEVAAGECYKWSVDDIAANLAIRAERTLLNPPEGLDLATIQSQILYASSNPDGAVAAVTPGIYHDNGVGIDSYIETAAHQDLLRPCQLGGVQMNIDGEGQGTVEVLAMRVKKDGAAAGAPGGAPSANAGFEKKLKKPWIGGVPYACGAGGQNERIRLRISNNKQPNVWFDVKWAAIYARPVASARSG